ncbi:MAG: methionine--tRNA ligase subunit beta [Nanoarchaeota archaeon]
MEGIIQFEDFAKVDLRVGEIKEVEEIEGADKLWKLSVDLGKEIGERTICAGIKEYYSKEELMNKKIIVVVNLAPRKMRGIESQGMLLAASEDEKTPQAYTQGAREPLRVPEPSRSERKSSTTLKSVLREKKDFSTKGKIYTKGKVVLISPEKDIKVGSKVS